MTIRILAAFAALWLIALAPSAQAADAWWRVVDVAADDVLNMRAAADPDARVVGAIPPGADGVHSSGAEARVGSRIWLEVTYAGQSGWVSSRYLAASSEPAAAATGQRVALVVGVSDYAGVAPPLRNPVRDARLMAERLSATGFDVEVLIDPDQGAILDGLERLKTRASSPEAALFYFSGHGLGLDGESNVVPRTSAGDDIERAIEQLVPLSTIMGSLEALGAESSIVILDACRNAPELIDAAERARGFGAVSVEATRGLGRVVAGRDFLVLYATDPNNVADDGTGANSPFTAALASRMQDPEVEIRETVRRVRGDVLAATDGGQSPWVEESLTSAFYFRPAPKVRIDDFFGVYGFDDSHSNFCEVSVTRSGTKLGIRNINGAREKAFDASFRGCGSNPIETDVGLADKAEIMRHAQSLGTDTDAFASMFCGQHLPTARQNFLAALGDASVPALTTSCGRLAARHYLLDDQLLLVLPQGDGQVDVVGVFERIR